MDKKLPVRISLILLLGIGLLGCQNATSNTAATDAIIGSWSRSPETITFQSSNSWTVVNTSTSATEATGTWVKSGSTYSLAQVTPSSYAYTATINGTTLSINNGTMTQDYIKN